MSIHQMKKTRSATAAEASAIVAKAAAENRDLTDDEAAKFDDLEKQVKRWDATISRAEQVQEWERTEAPVASQPGASHRQGPVITGGAPAAEGKKFADMGEFLKAVAMADHHGGRDRDPRLEFQAASGMNEQVPSEGGYLVQEDVAGVLQERATAEATLAPRCRRVPIGPGANRLKANIIDETSRATGSRLGGVRVYRSHEAGTVTASKPTFRTISLELEKLMGLAYVCEELLMDTAALPSIVSEAFAEEMAFTLDDEILSGTGAGECLGILNSPSLVSVTKETGQAADTVVAQNVIKMWSRMRAKNRGNSIWIMNQEVETQLPLMSLPVGTGGVSVFLPPNGLSQSPYSTLYGRPVIPIEQCPALGDVGDIMLVDMSQYLLIDKGGIKADASMHVRFIYDEMTYKFTMRVNGQPIPNSPITPYKGASTLSPFVALAAR